MPLVAASDRREQILFLKALSEGTGATGADSKTTHGSRRCGKLSPNADERNKDEARNTDLGDSTSLFNYDGSFADLDYGGRSRAVA